MIRLLTMAVLALPVAAQTPTFELASVRPQPWTNEGQVAVYVRGNTLYSEHADLYTLIDFAWNLPPDSSQVTGGPWWARHGGLSNVAGEGERLFQVIAKAPEGSSPTAEEFRQMLQSLLAERFRLRVRVTNREQPVFHLVAAKDGPKVTASAPDAEPSLRLADGKVFRISAVHTPIAVLVDELGAPSHGAGRPVVDQTGLTGFYDFEIEWVPGDVMAPEVDGKAATVFSAVGKLGLKLEPGTAVVPVVAIEHAEMPSAN
ncbi:MAG TPA: TIGR03435 family protein [Bryobacteraceae bacterium]|nr:TIGR03435 family protein [Bryobacteraceae bacterium]